MLVAGFLALTSAAVFLAPGRAAAPTLALQPDTVEAGGRSAATGADHTPAATVRLHLDEVSPATLLAEVVAGRTGGFSAELAVPETTPAGDHIVVTCEVISPRTCTIRARARLSVRAPATTTTSFSSSGTTNTTTSAPPSTEPLGTTSSTPGSATTAITVTTQPSLGSSAPAKAPGQPAPGGLVPPTTAPEGLPTNPTTPQFVGGESYDLFATGIEVTQGIQDLGNTMPLIPLRPTFARVYVAADDGSITGTRGILAGYRNGKLLGTATALNQPVTAVKNGRPRVELASSLLFRVPAGWTAGDQLQLTAFVYAGHPDTVFEHEPKSDNNFRSTTVGFHDQAVILRTVLAPIHLHDGFTDAGADITWFPADHPAEVATILSGLERSLPVSFILPVPLGFDFDPPGHDNSFAEWNIDENSNLEEGDAFEPLAIIQAWREASAEPMSTYPWYGVLPVVGDLDFWNAEIGEAIRYSGLSNGTVSMGEMSTATDADAPFEIKGSKTMAHELGHDLGLGHYGCIESSDEGVTIEEKGGALDEDFPTPYPNCRFAFVGPQGFYGLDVHYDRFPDLDEPSVIGNDLSFPKGQRAWPLMSYGEDKWADPYSYCRMLVAVDVPCNAYPPPDVGVPGPDGLQGKGLPVRLVSAQSDRASTLFVSGFATDDGTAGRLFEVGVQGDVPAASIQRSERRLAAMRAATPSTPVALVLYDGRGRELARHPLARTGPPPDESPRRAFSFVEWVPAPPGLARVALQGTGPPLAQREASRVAPEVQIVAPAVGTALPGPFTLEWQGEDADGDSLRYDVFASADAGVTWNVIARQLSATTLDVQAGQLPASKRTRLRVLAHDGFRTAHADTGDLSVPNSPPALVLVTGPPDGTTYGRRDLVVLSGRASDLEDGAVETLAWSSDRDGDIGTGTEVATRDLSAGEHVITLKATDRDGVTGEARLRVVIDSARSADVPDPAVLARLEAVLADHKGSDDGRSWWGPAAAVGAGVVVIAGAALAMRRRRRSTGTGPSDEPSGN